MFLSLPFRCSLLNGWNTLVASSLAMKTKPLQKLYSPSSCRRFTVVTKIWFASSQLQVWLQHRFFTTSTWSSTSFRRLVFTSTWSWQTATKPTSSSSANSARGVWNSSSKIRDPNQLSSRCSIQSTSSRTSITTFNGLSMNISFELSIGFCWNS